MEGSFSKENPKEKKKLDYEKIAKDVTDFAEEIGKDNYRQKIDYIGLEFYRTHRSLSDFTMFLQSSDMWTSYVKSLLESRGINEDMGDSYFKEYNEEERKILNGLNFQDENVFRNLIREISSKGSKSENRSFGKKHAGMLDFNSHFDKNGELNIHVHLPSKTNKEDNFNANPAKIKESLEILCDKLIEEKRAPRNITAQSWLMGVESIRKRMGFDILDVYEFSKSDSYQDGRFRGLTPSIWGQFVDKDGKIKQEEVAYLYEHGKPRYNLTKAGISFVKFVEIYGGKYKGKTIEFLNFEKTHLEGKKINKIKDLLWDVMITRDRKSLEDVLSRAKENDLFRDFLTSDVGIRFVRLIEEAMDQDDPEKFFKEEKQKEFAEISKQFGEMKEKYLQTIENEKIAIAF